MKQVVVTGAQGFIGRQAAAALASSGHEVWAVDRVAPSSPPHGIRHHVGDLTGAHPFPLESLGPSFTLLHLAWNLNRAGGRSDQVEQVELLDRLLKLSTGRLERVIAVGSAEEYGRRAGLLRETDAPVEPLSDYGWAKGEACRRLRGWSEVTGVPVVWLRPFVVYGPGQSGDMVVPYAVRCAKERRRAEFTDGAQQRDFVHVEDIARAMVAAVGAPCGGFQVVNLGRGESVAVRDVLDLIARLMNARDCFAMGARPRRPGEPDEQRADVAVAEKLLGWRANIGWREGITALCRASKA